MLLLQIELTRLNLAHFAFSETSGALDVLLSHGIGVRIARLTDVVEVEFQSIPSALEVPKRALLRSRLNDVHSIVIAFYTLLKKGIPSRDSASTTLSPISTRAPSILAVSRFSPSSVTSTS